MPRPTRALATREKGGPPRASRRRTFDGRCSGASGGVRTCPVLLALRPCWCRLGCVRLAARWQGGTQRGARASSVKVPSASRASARPPQEKSSRMCVARLINCLRPARGRSAGGVRRVAGGVRDDVSGRRAREGSGRGARRHLAGRRLAADWQLCATGSQLPSRPQSEFCQSPTTVRNQTEFWREPLAEFSELTRSAVIPTAHGFRRANASQSQRHGCRDSVSTVPLVPYCARGYSYCRFW